jgi:prolyl 4-hydroxylase
MKMDANNPIQIVYNFIGFDAPAMAQLKPSDGGQRFASFLIYLNTVEAGGETRFPKLNISVKPIAGRALYFRNLYFNGTEHQLSLHGGDPVLKGEKYLATKWMRMNQWG